MNECYRKYFYLNNKFLPCKDFDETFLSKGTSIYDVIRIKNYVPLFIESYLKRIKKSAFITNRTIWLSDDEIIKIVHDIININKIEEDSLKLVFSYNNTTFGKTQNIFVAFFMRNNAPTIQQFNNGVNTISFKAERNTPHAKIVNMFLRKNTVKQINESNAYESILINRNNIVTEGSRSNVFFIKNKTVYTPNVETVLPGITRKKVIDICKNKEIEIIEKSIPLKTISEFDSMFITGTSRKVLPVKKLDNTEFNINNEILRLIMNEYDKLITNYIKNYKN